MNQKLAFTFGKSVKAAALVKRSAETSAGLLDHWVVSPLIGVDSRTGQPLTSPSWTAPEFAEPSWAPNEETARLAREQAIKAHNRPLDTHGVATSRFNPTTGRWEAAQNAREGWTSYFLGSGEYNPSWNPETRRHEGTRTLARDLWQNVVTNPQYAADWMYRRWNKLPSFDEQRRQENAALQQQLQQTAARERELSAPKLDPQKFDMRWNRAFAPPGQVSAYQAPGTKPTSKDPAVQKLYTRLHGNL